MVSRRCSRAGNRTAFAGKASGGGGLSAMQPARAKTFQDEYVRGYVVRLPSLSPGFTKRASVLYTERDGRVAQLVEQCPFKAWVAGSNPAALTIIRLLFFFTSLAQFEIQFSVSACRKEINRD